MSRHTTAGVEPEHRPRKRYGQHFLHDAGVVARIIAAIAPTAHQTLVEIGPGPGALTRPLLASGCTLHVIEIDRDLAARLEELARTAPGLVVHTADVLEFDFRSLVEATPERLRLVGNLPYNISTPLLFRCLDLAARIADLHFMLQREVAERMSARAGSAAYGRLSVMVQATCTVERLFTVGAGAFKPPPKVESAVVRLEPRAERPDPVVLDTLAELTRLAFGQRRKTLHNALRGRCSDAALRAVGIDPAARAETVSVERYLALAASL